MFHLSGPGSFCVITFNEMTMSADGRRFWGRDVLHRLGIPALGIMAKRPHWFADSLMTAALAACRAAVGAYSDRLTYGFSMGAFGAIRHAEALGARTVIACSPQWTLDPALMVGMPQPFVQHFRPGLHAGLTLTASSKNARLYLLHDPYEPHDTWHAARIVEHVRGAVPVEMPFVGHGTVRPLASSEEASALFAAARAHDDEAVRSAARDARRRWPMRAFGLAAWLASRNFERGAAVLRAARVRPPAHYPAVVWLLYARKALELGRPARSARMLTRAAELAAGHPTLLAQIGVLEREIAAHRTRAR